MTDRPLLARILAALGALLLVSAPVTLLFFAGIGPDGRLTAVGWVAAAKAALGAGALVLAVLSGSPGGTRRFFTGRAAHYGFFTAISALLVGAILVIANWAAWVWPKTWDLTRDRIFTLAPDTVQTLGRLDHDVRALAFYRQDEPDASLAEDLLRRYAALSPRFGWEVVDPYRSPEQVKRYEITERSPRIVLVAGDRISRAKAPTEEALTNALVELAGVARRKVYFLGGHGEPSPEDASGAGYSLVAAALRDDGFDVARLSLLERREVPADAAVVLVAGPRTALLPPEVKALGEWLDRGGKLGVYLEPGTDAGLDPLLAARGIEAGNDLVVDPSPVSSLFGGSASTPLVGPAGDHPIVKDLGNLALAFPTARSLVALTAVRPPPVPLVLTSSSAWAETDVKGAFESGSVRQGPGEKTGPFPVAMAASRPASGGAGEERLLVVGDSEFFGDRYQQVLGNRDFFLNGVAWLGERADRITIRPRAREASQLVLTEAQVSAIRFFTVDALPLALLGLGLGVWLVRRAR